MDALPQFAKNLRTTLWRRGLASSQWIKEVAQGGGVTSQRAEELLRGLGESPSSKELDAISILTEVSAEELGYEDLLGGVDVLRENVKALLDTLPHGGQLAFAKEIDVDATTVSRWATGKSVPKSQANLSAIRKYFHLPANVDLEATPLFLDLEPVGGIAKRKQLQQLLAELSTAKIDELYAALRKLLR